MAFNDESFPNKHQLDLSYFWDEINEIARRDEWYYYEGIDFKDAIILHFRNIISNLETKYNNEKLVKPNENVLPLHYGHEYYSDGKYSFNHELYIFFNFSIDLSSFKSILFSIYE